MSAATLRARAPSSRQMTVFVIITLSLTYAPIGSAFATAFLYASIIGAICGAAEKLKPIAPRPFSPAFAKVGGLPHACQIGGCGFFQGFGSRLRFGASKNFPWNSYSESRNIFG